ncbi:MAG: dockerin type I domain-containing protein [Candidatus Gottesmanbacteria bacterium]
MDNTDLKVSGITEEKVNKFSTRKKIFTLVSLFVLLSSLLIGTRLVQKSQETRKGAAGERVDLSFAPPSNPVSVGPNTEFTVDVVAAPVNSVKVTAATIVVNFPSYISLVSITPKTFFSYPTNTEMLALGVSCNTASVQTDCRTTASGITCSASPGFCKNATYPANTSTQLRFDLGAACDVTHLGCLNNTCAVLKGSGTDSCTDDSSCSGQAGSGTVAQCYPATTSNVLATIRFKSGANTGSGGNISFNATTEAAGLDSGGNVISTNIGSIGPLIPVNVIVGPSPLPSVSPVPSASPSPGTATLNFKIKFQGITSAKPNKQVTVTLKNGPTYNNVSVASDANGIYSGTITNISTGTYEVLIKGFVHLRKNLGSVTFGQGQTVDKDWSTIDLKAGDIDGNNTINAVDIARVIQDYFPNSPTNSPADFNLDGTVNAVDIGFLIGNYFQTGDQ